MYTRESNGTMFCPSYGVKMATRQHQINLLLLWPCDVLSTSTFVLTSWLVGNVYVGGTYTTHARTNACTLARAHMHLINIFVNMFIKLEVYHSSTISDYTTNNFYSLPMAVETSKWVEIISCVIRNCTWTYKYSYDFGFRNY